MNNLSRKIVASIAIFILIFVVLYNVVDVIEHPLLVEGAILVRSANKVLAVTSMTCILGFCILEITQLTIYITSIKDKENRRINLIRLIVVTVILGGLMVFAYHIYTLTSIPLIDYARSVL